MSPNLARPSRSTLAEGYAAHISTARSPHAAGLIGYQWGELIRMSGLPESVAQRERPIRSFHPRRSRITPRAASALAELLPLYGVDPGAVPADPRSLFPGRPEVVLEIGPGMGQATLEMAAADPDVGIFAVDVHTPGIGALLAGVAELGLDNVRVSVGDAVEVMAQLAPASLAGIRVYFPDPWPKVRHHKRRLVDAKFARRAALLLEPGGQLHLATDVEGYAEQMRAVCAAEPLLINPAGGYQPGRAGRPITKYEELGRRAGRISRDLLLVRTGQPA